MKRMRLARKRRRGRFVLGAIFCTVGAAFKFDAVTDYIQVKRGTFSSPTYDVVASWAGRERTQLKALEIATPLEHELAKQAEQYIHKFEVSTAAGIVAMVLLSACVKNLVGLAFLLLGMMVLILGRQNDTSLRIIEKLQQ